MCLALPYQIISVKGKTAVAKCLTLDKKPIGIQLVKNLKKGDYVLVQNNTAVKKIPKKEALEVYKLLKINPAPFHRVLNPVKRISVR